MRDDGDNFIETDRKSLGSVTGDTGVFKWAPRGKWAPPRMPTKPIRPGSYKHRTEGTIKHYTDFMFNGELPGKYWQALPFKYRLDRDPEYDEKGNKLTWRNTKVTMGRPYVRPGNKLSEAQYDRFTDALDRFQAADKDYADPHGKIWTFYQKKLDRYTQQLIKYTKRKAHQAELHAQRLQHAAERAAKREKRAKKITHKNYAGWNPWNPKYGEFRALTDEQYTDIGMDINAVLKPEKTIMTLPDGSRVSVIKSQDGVPLGFGSFYGYGAKSEPVIENGVSSHEYYKKAFDGSDPQVDKDTWDGDCGHISHLAYSAKAQVLEVTFKNKNETYVYFRVPSTVAGELLTFARGGQIHHYDKDGTPRHLLGVRFWDLIRIRHTHGSRYRYELGSDLIDEYVDGDGERPVNNKMSKWYERDDKELDDEMQLTDELMTTRPKHIQQMYKILQDYRKTHNGENPDRNYFMRLYDKIVKPHVANVVYDEKNKNKRSIYDVGTLDMSAHEKKATVIERAYVDSLVDRLENIDDETLFNEYWNV